MSDFSNFDRFYKEQMEVKKWEHDRQVDALLTEGVTQGLTFAEYRQRTQCPEHLEARYNRLAAQERRKPENDPFLKGFEGTGYNTWNSGH